MIFEALLTSILAIGATTLKMTSHVPILAIGLLIMTLQRTYKLWFARRGEDQAGILFPAISELGVEGQGRRAYQIGFACVGALLCLHMYNLSIVLQRELVRGDMDAAKLQSQMIRYGYQAAIGCGVQGIFTLEHNISAQSIIHWIAAALFMHGSLNHAQASNELYTNTNISLPLWISRVSKFRGMILKYSTIVMFLPILFSQIFGAAVSGNANNGGSRMMNSMGLMQYFIVAQFSVLFMSYAVDLNIWC
eukprot:g5213.t1